MQQSKEIKLNRKFGYTIAIVLLLIALFRIFIRHQQGWWLMFAIAMLLLAAALLIPGRLSPLRLVWDKIGHVLGLINTFVLLTVFYFVILTPLGLLMRLFGKDILKLKASPKQNTYWEESPQGVDNGMMNQF